MRAIYVGPYGGSKEIKRTYQFPAKHLAMPNPVITSGYNRNIIFDPPPSSTLDFSVSRVSGFSRVRTIQTKVCKPWRNKSRELRRASIDNRREEGASFTILTRIVRARGDSRRRQTKFYYTAPRVTCEPVNRRLFRHRHCHRSRTCSAR